MCVCVYVCVCVCVYVPLKYKPLSYLCTGSELFDYIENAFDVCIGRVCSQFHLSANNRGNKYLTIHLTRDNMIIIT